MSRSCRYASLSLIGFWLQIILASLKIVRSVSIASALLSHRDANCRTRLDVSVKRLH